MIRPLPNAPEVSRHVTELPAEFEVQRVEDHWLVAGPTGIFVVGRTDGPDVVHAAAATSLFAHDVRSALSDLMTWVPFVDALLVAPTDQLGRPDAANLACTVVDLSMLPIALTGGSEVISADELTELYHHLPLVATAVQGSLPTPR